MREHLKIMKNSLVINIFLLSFSFCYNLDSCNYSLVESIPDGLKFNEFNNLPATSEKWIELIDNAKTSIHIAQFYFSLKCSDVLNKTIESCIPGENVLKALINAGKRQVKIKIVLNDNKDKYQNEDIDLLLKNNAEINYLNFTKLIGSGILHTKFIIVDGLSFYLGSANMDWRALTQTKELGIVVNNCFVLTLDLDKIFSIYWFISEKKIIPDNFPSNFDTLINLNKSLDIILNEDKSKVYLTSSPKKFNSLNRSNDIDSILDIIRTAKKYVCFSVMDYSPTFLYKYPTKFWPIIDNELRNSVVSRGIQIKIIIGYWKHTRKDIIVFLHSLNAIKNLKNNGSITIKLFKVPFTNEEQKLIPFSRVDHCKFLFNEKKGFIGTSNWSGDYFLYTGGVSIIEEDESYSNSTIRGQLENVFNRDWNSEYSEYL